MELKKFENDTIAYNASAFIIPNSLGKIKDFITSRDEKREYIKTVLDLNGLTDVDPDEELLVQLWFHSTKDLETDNIARHGFTCLLDGLKTHISPYDMELLPVSLFKGKKEGDWIDIKVPVGLDRPSSVNSSRIGTMEIHLQLDQTHYRYGNHGSFDELLEKLINSYIGR